MEGVDTGGAVAVGGEIPEDDGRQIIIHLKKEKAGAVRLAGSHGAGEERSGDARIGLQEDAPIPRLRRNMTELRLAKEISLRNWERKRPLPRLSTTETRSRSVWASEQRLWAIWRPPWALAEKSQSAMEMAERP